MKDKKATVTRFSTRDRKLISRALGELAASLDLPHKSKRERTYAINIMKKWDGLPSGTLEIKH